MNFILWLTLPCYFFSLLISCDAVHFDHVEETHQCVLPPVVGADDLAWVCVDDIKNIIIGLLTTF